MKLFDKLLNNVFSKNILGFGGEIPATEPRLPIYPGWFYAAPFGQPRSINITDIRTYSKSPWVQMVKNTIKKEIGIIEWDIVPVDSEDETDYTKEIELVKDKLNFVNSDREDITETILPMIDDVLDIDAGAWIKVYSLDSYTEGEVPVYGSLGNVVGTNKGLILKPFGQRTLNEIKFADGSTILRQTDIYRRTLAWYQYSFKNPKTNPKRFFPEEVVYFMMNKKTDSVYGFSPVQSIQQILELLMNSTRWNKDYFKNNAIPDGIIGLPNADANSMKKFKSMWNKEFKGKAHKLLFHNTAAQFTQFMSNSKDMEWLEGQKWYFHLVFGAFGVSPAEAGFHEDVNRSSQEGQERVTVKNAIKPYLKLIEKNINRHIITEILQQDNPGIMFKYVPKDHAEEQIEFEQSMKEIEAGTLTINEYRKRKDMDPVEWGDEPVKAQAPQMAEEDSEDSNKTEPNKPNDNKDKDSKKEKTIPYSKAFEAFMER